jgi:hypothetical protein
MYPLFLRIFSMPHHWGQHSRIGFCRRDRSSCPNPICPIRRKLHPPIRIRLSAKGTTGVMKCGVSRFLILLRYTYSGMSTHYRTRESEWQRSIAPPSTSIWCWPLVKASTTDANNRLSPPLLSSKVRPY